LNCQEIFTHLELRLAEDDLGVGLAIFLGKLGEYRLIQQTAVTVTLDDKTLVQGTDYTVSYSDNTNAGTATVTATGTGIYLDMVTTTFEITPKEITAALTGTTSKTYDGTINPPTGLSLTLDGVIDGDDVTVSAGSIAYNSAGVQTADTITASGITLAGAAKDNYRLVSDTVSVAGAITKSQPAIVFSSSYAPDKAYDGQEIGYPGASDLTVTGAAFADVEFTWSATPQNAGTYTLTATIPATDNTETATAQRTVTISREAVTPAVTITPDSYEYTGSAIQPGGNAVKALDGDKEIASTEYTLSYGENIHVGAGVPNAVVTLMRGTQVVAAERTDSNGRFTFSGVPVGIYNLKAEKGGIAKTVKQEITSGDARLTIVLPTGKTNSVVEIKNEETPPVIVGELNQLFTDTSIYTPEDQEAVNNGGAVEIKLTVEKQDAPPEAAKIEAVKKKVTANRTNAASGTTVTLTVTPDTGYVPLDLAVPDENQEKPCDGGVDCPSSAYADLRTGTWYHEAADYAIREGLLAGFEDGTFRPDSPLTRGQLAQILYNMEGRPSVNGGSSFLDVAPDSWYADAAIWAAAQGIVGGLAPRGRPHGRRWRRC